MILPYLFETIGSRRFYEQAAESYGRLHNTKLMFKGFNTEDVPTISNIIASDIKRANIILLTDDALKKDRTNITDDEMNNVADLSTPFPVCWFENVSRDTGIAIIEPNAAEYAYAILEIGALLVEEMPGGDHLLTFNLGTVAKNPTIVTVRFLASKRKEIKMHEALYYAASHVVNCIYRKTNNVGEVKTNIRIKERKGQGIHKIKKLVIVDEKENTSLSIYEGKHIDWKHSWEVMGHWRNVAGGVGKNRQGEYVVPGRTWIKPYQKGEGPLIPKIRLVKDLGKK